MGNERGRIEKEFQRYSLYEDLKDLRNECIPEIDKFYEELQAQKRQNGVNAEMIQRFDEVILHKASKIDLNEVDGRKMEKYQLVSIQKDIDAKVKSMIAEQEHIMKV